MEFRTPVAELQSIFAKLGNVVKMNNDDVTGMVVIEADDMVRFKATGGNVSTIIESHNSTIIEKGKTMVRFREMKGYVSKFVPLVDDYGTEDFHFKVEGRYVFIRTKTAFPSKKPSYRKLSVQIFDEPFPTLRDFGEAQIILNSSILKNGISKVLHCVNPAEVRSAMTGVSITFKKERVVFAGTNGVKLAEFRAPMNADMDDKSYIFKYDTSYCMRTMLDDDTQVFLNFEGRHVYIKSNEVYIIGSLIINEKYPNYIPMLNLDHKITFPRMDLSDSVHTLMEVLDPEDNNRLTINFTDNVLTLKNDVAEAVHTFDDAFGDNLDIDVNGVFFDSLLKDMFGSTLEILFRPGENYFVVKSVEYPDHTALITVIRRR